MAAVVVILVILIGAALAGVLALARRQRKSMAADNEIIPGRRTRAPASWARSHDPEARLHRRLRDAMTALHTINAIDDGTTIVLRAGLEQSALAVDDQLVAISVLPQPHRDQRLPEATEAVEGIEDAVAQYASATTSYNRNALAADLSGVQARLDAISEIRKSLERG